MSREKRYHFDDPDFEERVRRYTQQREMDVYLEARTQPLWRAQSGRSVGVYLLLFIPLGYVCGFVPGFLMALVAWSRVTHDYSLCGVRPKGYWLAFLYFWLGLLLIIVGTLTLIVLAAMGYHPPG
jgi:hypothetical protein